MEIEDHALIYALLCRNVIGERKDGEKLIARITTSYGETRGRRMAKNALKENMALDLEAYFVFGEWKGKEAENISEIEYGEKETISKVSRCKWYDTWKKYDLEDYGRYYCKYIDRAICKGFDGDFDLVVEETLSENKKECLFRWNKSVNKERIAELKKYYKDRYIRSFDLHVKELLECAMMVLNDKELIDKTIKEYEIIKRRQGSD